MCSYLEKCNSFWGQNLQTMKEKNYLVLNVYHSILTYQASIQQTKNTKIIKKLIIILSKLKKTKENHNLEKSTVRL